MLRSLSALIALMVVGFLFFQCGKKEDSSTDEGGSSAGPNDGEDGEDGEDDGEDTGDDSGTGTSGVTGTLQLDPSFPSGVALSALNENLVDSTGHIAPAVNGTVQIDAESALTKKQISPCDDVDLDAVMGTTPDGAGGGGQLKNDNMYMLCRDSMSYRDKFQEQAGVVSGEAENCFRRRWIQAAVLQMGDGCYTFAMSNNSGYKQPEGKLCTVEFAKMEQNKVALVVETGLLLAGAAICQAKKAGVDTELKTANASIDLKSHLEKAFSEASEDATVTKAQIKRLADESGRPVFRTEIELGNTQSGTRKISDYSIVVVNSPPAADSADFHGAMWISYSKVGGSNDKALMGLRYSHSGKTTADLRTVYEARGIENLLLAGSASAADIMTSGGVLDYENMFTAPGGGTVDSSYITGNPNGLRYVSIDINPWTGAGEIAVFQNPGPQTYNERAVGMSFEAAESGGTLKGCAVAGRVGNTSVRKILREGGTFKPDGRDCTSGADGGICNGGSENNDVYYQCFQRDSDGVFAIDSSKITDTATGYDVIAGSSVTITGIGAADIPSFSQDVTN